MLFKDFHNFEEVLQADCIPISVEVLSVSCRELNSCDLTIVINNYFTFRIHQYFKKVQENRGIKINAVIIDNNAIIKEIILRVSNN